MELDGETLLHRLWGEWRNQEEDHRAPQTLTTAGSGYFPDDGRKKEKFWWTQEMRFSWQKVDLRWTLLAKLE